MRLIPQVGLAILLCGAPVAAFADAVYLRNGDVIEGNILRSTDAWTVIKSGTKIFRYDASQIDRVEQDSAEESVDAADEELTDDKRAAIKALLSANGVEKMIRNNVETALANAPADRREEFRSLLKADVLIDLLIPVYAKKFSTKELEKLVIFFESQVGKKLVENNSVILEETFQVITEYFRSRSAL